VNTRYETDRDLHRDLQDLHEPGGQDREISLGTTTILGIFFALALLCAVFFGFGYSLGRRSALTVAGPAIVANESESGSSKPSPGSPAGQATSKQPAGTAQSAIAAPSAIVAIDQPNPAAQDNQQIAAPNPIKAVALTRRDPNTEPSAYTPTKSAAIVPVAATTPSSGSPVVQVAAMSHQEDADVVAVDLKRRGYTVAIRREPQDKLFHVQIGPFATKKEADAMRQHLQTDGYNNAIVK
jgi:cell division septation protein DedD